MTPQLNRTSPQVRQELARIHREHGGLLLAEDVVREAADAASLLHPFFTWDQTEAARQWNLQEARQLINVQVQYEPHIEREIQFFVSLRADRIQPGGGYRIQLEVFGDVDLRAQRLSDALREMAHFQRKFRDLEELADVFRAMGNVPPPAPPPPGPNASPPPASGGPAPSMPPPLPAAGGEMGPALL